MFCRIASIQWIVAVARGDRYLWPSELGCGASCDRDRDPYGSVRPTFAGCFPNLKQFFSLIGFGIVAELVLTFTVRRILTRTFAAMNVGISGSLMIAGFSLVFVAAMAATIPAYRSATIDPVVALRSE
jgi:hypothetical protein